MRVNASKWVLPGILTVFLGTAGTVEFTKSNIEADLAANAQTALANAGLDWANAQFDARDVVVSGVVADADLAAKVSSVFEKLHGVRSVSTALEMAPLASPYPFEVTVENGKISFFGGIPDESVRKSLAEQSGGNVAGLKILSGLPDRALWLAAVDFAIRQSARLENGTIRLADLALSGEGRASSHDDFDTLNAALLTALPKGVLSKQIHILPPVEKPYIWNASFDGKVLRVDGFVPSLEDEAEILGIAPQGVAAASISVPASGEPQSFVQTAKSLVEGFAFVENGEAHIVDAVATFSGAPTSPESDAKLRTLLAKVGSKAELSPPYIGEYWFSAGAIDSRITLSGYVPEQETRIRLASLEGVDATGLALGRGAPKNFDASVELGLNSLGFLSSGQFFLKGEVLSLGGKARTPSDYQAVHQLLAQSAPEGITTDVILIEPASVSPFLWSATLDDKGSTFVSGYVPSAEVRRALMVVASAQTIDATQIAKGEPEGFESSAILGLQLMSQMQEGQVEFDGSRWHFKGIAKSFESGEELSKLIANQGLTGKNWEIELSVPEKVLPTASPYLFTATNVNGDISIAGHLPSADILDTVSALPNVQLGDEISLAQGEPEGFEVDMSAGLAALGMLQSGKLSYDGAGWYLTGNAQDIEARTQTLHLLAAQSSLTAWAASVDVPSLAAVDAINEAVGAGPTLAMDVLGQAPQLPAADTINAAVEAGSLSTMAALAEAPQLPAVDTINAAVGATTMSSMAMLAEAPQIPAVDAINAAVNAAPLEDIAILSQAPTMPENIAVEANMNPVVEAEAEPEDSGSASAEVSLSAPIETPLAKPVNPDYAFFAKRQNGGAVELGGSLPVEAARQYVKILLGDVDIDGIGIDEDAPAGFTTAAMGGLRAVSALTDAELTFKDQAWSFRGKSADDSARVRATTQLANIAGSENWSINIKGPTPTEVCVTNVAQFAADNTILFDPGSDHITADSLSAIDTLAGYLSACPNASVHVEGHTDADGDETSNLILSVSRAEAVVDELIARQISAKRLYAVGYGESLPIASNDTSKGKSLNRRIVFTIVDEPQ